MSKGTWKLSAFAVSTVAVLAVLGILLTRGGETVAAQAGAAANVDRWLAGTIDFHVHGTPDMEARKMDVIDLAKSAKAHGMRGLVLKNHFEDTAGLAFLVRKEVPGLEVFGGIVLNRPAGGINPAAVENMVAWTGGYGKVVWFPTRDGEAQVAGEVGRNPNAKRPFVSVSKNGMLLPEVRDVIAVIAKHQLVMETGHSSPEEGLMLLAEGKKQGVQHMLVTHAANNYTLEQLQQATKLGGMVEVVYSTVGIMPDAKPRYPPAAAAELFRKVGVDWVVLSTDLGQPANPDPPQGFGEYIAKLAAAGMTPQELKKMTQDNPAKLLGIPVK